MAERISFIGYGAIARVHAEILRREGVVFETVVGRVAEDAAAFAAEFGFRRLSTDISAMVDDGSDAVVVTSPSALHYAHGRAALNAGKHVLMEIPLAMSYGEGKDLVDLAASRGRNLMVCHSRRFIPSVAAVQARVANGSLRVHHVVVRWGIYRRQNVGWTGRPRSWKDNLLWHHGCHFVDTALWLMGAREATVMGQVSPPDPGTGISMELDILMRTPADQLASVALSYNTHMRQEEFYIVGKEDTIRFDQGTFYGPDGAREDLGGEGSGYMQVAWETQDREFLAALREGRAPSMSGEDALPALAVLQEIQDRYVR